MSFKDDCAECAARLLADYEEGGHRTRPSENDTRLCTTCHVFDDEEEQIKRIPDSYVNNPTDYL